jgi:peptide-methionine (S)-S-oxide reductase
MLLLSGIFPKTVYVWRVSRQIIEPCRSIDQLAQAARKITQMSQAENGREVATLGGGCFWCLEAVYDELQGMERVVSGYAGGHVTNPTYQQICGGRTGHAEVVQVTFDPEQVSFRDILLVFFQIHDPTTLNRQGADVGPQYRSIILYHNDAQKQVAEEVIAELTAERVWEKPIVTQVEPFEVFYPAEEYHQDYYKNNTYQPYCQVVIAPKLAKFRKEFAANRKN